MKEKQMVNHKDLEIKAIARVIQKAQKLHEESYSVRKLPEGYGEYTKGWEECFIEECKEEGLSSQFWYVLYLANHWYNDLQWWSEQVLSDKDIHEDMILPEDIKEGK